MKEQKFKKLLLLQKDWQDESNFKIIEDSIWEEIQFDAIPILLEKIEETKDKYTYSVSIPLLSTPYTYIRHGIIEIPIHLNEKFLKIFQEDLEQIHQIEQILHLKYIQKNQYYNKKQ